MSITTSVGLASGIDTGALIEQLLAIEARPQQLAQQRVAQLQQRQAAYLSLNSSLLGLSGSADVFTSQRIFDSATATTTNDEILTASASSRAAEGTYTFVVDRLVSTKQVLSRGFADRDTAAFGANSFTFEGREAAIDDDIALTELLGGTGVSRGQFSITDTSGNTAVIDATRAVTLQDVVDEINLAQGITVTADVVDNRLRLSDAVAGGGNLIIQDLPGYQTATDLGIATTPTGTAANSLSSAELSVLSRNTALSALNDGLGIMIRDGTADPELIIDLDGTEFATIELGRVEQTYVTQDFESQGLMFTADTVYVPPDNPPDGFVAPPTEVRVDRARAATVGDLIDAIETQTNGRIKVDIDASNGTLTFRDDMGTSDITIRNGSSAQTTADDLKVSGVTGTGGSLTTGRLLAGAGTVLLDSLNGGSGINFSSLDLTITDRSGTEWELADLIEDELTVGGIFTPPSTLDQLVEVINDVLVDEGASNLRVDVNSTRRGLTVIDSSTATPTSNLIVTGGLASQLGLSTGSGGVASNETQGTSLEKQYVGLQQQLSDFRGGIGEGTIRITDAAGAVAEININEGVTTLKDLVDRISSNTTINVTARINDTGDGIAIVDDNGLFGSNSSILIEDVSGRVARDLRLEGEFTSDGTSLVADGSFQTVVTFDSTDTLDDVVQKINNSDAGVGVTVLNDGSEFSPFRLNLTSRESGVDGDFLLDTGGFDLGARTLSEAEDAVVFFGSDDPADAVLLTSSSNTLDRVIQNVTIDLVSASTEPVTVTVAQDIASIESAVDDFVASYNAVIDTIDGLTFFNAETLERGVLFGDATVLNVERSMVRIIQAPGALQGDLAFQRLFEVGIAIGEGGQLNFDRDRFREALESDPDDVESLFSERELLPNEPVQVLPGTFVADTQDDFGRLGVPARIGLLMDDLTNSVDGIVTARTDGIDTQIEQQNDRIAFLGEQLEDRRARLELEFLQMEQAIAQLQSQSASLSTLQPA
ncbi:MAG: flagellar filament capping protein FliD [Planctomycetota bacterium]